MKKRPSVRNLLQLRRQLNELKDIVYRMLRELAPMARVVNRTEEMAEQHDEVLRLVAQMITNDQDLSQVELNTLSDFIEEAEKRAGEEDSDECA